MRALAGALLLAFCCTTAAQLRTIPQDARRGVLRHAQEMVVEIDGVATQLAAGAQIRDASNRIVVPLAVPPGALVRYRLDTEGRVSEVWLLSPEEAAQPDKAK
jgi:hypothetical protein